MTKFLLPILFATSFFTQAQIVNIPDANFLKALIAKGVDKNLDGKIQTSEALAVDSLNISSKSIIDLTGIESFTNVTFLDCQLNYDLTTLFISNNLKLMYLDCSNTKISNLILSSNLAFTHLKCYGSKVTQLDLSKNTQLIYLNCLGNKMTSLDVSKNKKLAALECNFNSLTVLDVSNNTELTWLGCTDNQLPKLDLTKNILLDGAACYNNLLTTLDISSNKLMTQLYCFGNPKLSQICINSDQATLVSNTQKWMKDASAIWNSSCGVITSLDYEKSETLGKVLLKVITPLGQEINPKNCQGGIYIYQYTDGSSIKVMNNIE